MGQHRLYPLCSGPRVPAEGDTASGDTHGFLAGSYSRGHVEILADTLSVPNSWLGSSRWVNRKNAFRPVWIDCTRS